MAEKGGEGVETLRLLYVCTGNTCRSPMAAALTEQLAGQLNVPFRLQTRSRGLYAVDGDPMSVHAQAALAEQGVTAEHRAAMLEEEDLEWADLVLTMTFQHKRFLWEAFPAYQDKTFTLKEYIRELENSVHNKIPAASENETEAPADFSWEYLTNYFSSLDVRDPYGGDLEDYRQTRDELAASIRRLLELLAATVDARENRI